jgi:hypothetical protein
MVYKVPGVDTFWEWFERNFQCSHNLGSYQKDDWVLRYSTKGSINAKPGRSVALCWELLPELKKVFNTTEWDAYINLTYQCAASCDRILITSEFSRPYYEPYGKVDIMPIGVDTDLFKPMNKEEMRNKYGIPQDKEVGFWCGSTHPMKGMQNVQKYADENPNIFWVLVWYNERANLHLKGCEFFQVPQWHMAELMNCADFQLSASILRPYYIVEYEGMACNLPQRKILNIEKDFEAGDHPRDRIFEKQWDRNTVKKLWEEYLT